MTQTLKQLYKNYQNAARHDRIYNYAAYAGVVITGASLAGLAGNLFSNEGIGANSVYVGFLASGALMFPAAKLSGREARRRKLATQQQLENAIELSETVQSTKQ